MEVLFCLCISTKGVGYRQYRCLLRPQTQAVPYWVIDTKRSSIVDRPPMFTFGIPLTSYITYRQIVGEIIKYSS
jgi:hypothetical protein